MPAVPAANSLGKLHLAPQKNESAKLAEVAFAAIHQTYDESLQRRLSQIESNSAQLDIADRAGFIRRNSEIAQREEKTKLVESLDQFAKNHLAPLQHLKEPTPDKRVMLVTRGSKSPQALTAAALACEGMLRAELEGFAGQLLAEIAEQPDGPTNDQCAFVAAIMNRAGRLDRNDRPFSSSELAAAVHTPEFDGHSKQLNEARQRLTNLEARWTDLRRTGKISAVTRVKNALASGALERDELAPLRK